MTRFSVRTIPAPAMRDEPRYDLTTRLGALELDHRRADLSKGSMLRLQ